MLLGQPSGRRSDSPPDGVTDSPSGGALGISDGHSGSPSGGTLRISDGHSDSPLGGTPRISDGHSNSPSGGTPELRSKLRPLYQVAHIRCQLSGRASPSRTSSCRNPDSLSALRNYFVGGREESQILHALLVRVGCLSGEPLSTSIYRKRQGVECHLKNPKCPCFMSYIKGQNGDASGAPHG